VVYNRKVGGFLFDGNNNQVIEKDGDIEAGSGLSEEEEVLNENKDIEVTYS
jgi:hypothetical protein